MCDSGSGGIDDGTIGCVAVLYLWNKVQKMKLELQEMKLELVALRAIIWNIGRVAVGVAYLSDDGKKIFFGDGISDDLAKSNVILKDVEGKINEEKK